MASVEGLGFWAFAQQDPERVALVDSAGGETTYGELLRRSRSLARVLCDVGLVPGDAIAAVLTNEPAFFEVLLAALEFGWYLVPVNSHLAAPEVQHVIVDSEAKAVVVSEHLSHLVDDAVELARLGDRNRIVVGAAEGFTSLEDARIEEGPLPPRTPGTTMMYTSGTTGRPKGVRRPLPEGDPNDIAAEVASVTAQGFGVRPGEGVHLVCGPLYHAGPFVGASTALHVGHALVLMEKWSAEAFLGLVETRRVTNTQMVPTMFHRLLALPEAVRSGSDVSSLTSVFHTGAPCPVEVKVAMMEWWGPIIYETYGGTEAVATIATPRRWLQKPGTVGRPIHGVAVHILDDDGSLCPPGTPGSIYIESSRGSETEYFKDREKTDSVHRDGLVTLGDVGHLDHDGYLFLNDRKIDMIISGGVNIYPAEIESTLLACPGVADVAVVGVPDDEWGEQVLAVVELAEDVPGDDEAEDRLRAFCEGRLGRFKRPRHYEFVPLLPRLPNGKVEKRRLREQYWLDVDRAI